MCCALAIEIAIDNNLNETRRSASSILLNASYTVPLVDVDNDQVVVFVATGKETAATASRTRIVGGTEVTKIGKSPGSNKS